MPPGAPGLTQHEAEMAKAGRPAIDTSKLSPDKTLRGVRVFTKAEVEIMQKTAGRTSWWSRLRPAGKVGVGLVGAAIVILGFAAIYWAFEKAHQKMGEGADLSMFLPKGNKVAWISAPYTRRAREAVAPFYEPNVVADDIIIRSSCDNVVAFGISLQGLPEEFANSTNINELGEGNSDWLCESFGGYLICRSLSDSYPLIKDKTSVVTLQFHLPAEEMRQLLKFTSGTRSAYLITGR